ncbi:MAG: elongation factor 1-alpha C-terminal domain-related protein [Planctomycetota bacterium]
MYDAEAESVGKRVDPSTLEIIEENAESGKNLEVAEVIIRTCKLVVIKTFSDVRELGRFVLVQDEDIYPGGIIAAAS